MWGMPKCAAISAPCVPLPAPGGAIISTRIVISSPHHPPSAGRWIPRLTARAAETGRFCWLTPGWLCSRLRARCWIGAFDGAREGGACRDAQLVEDVAQVGLDGLLAQEQLRGDLRVGLAVDDEPRHLEFAAGQRLDACPVGLARPGAAMG